MQPANLYNRNPNCNPNHNPIAGGRRFPSPSVLIMGRGPVTCVGASWQRNGNMRNINHWLCGRARSVSIPLYGLYEREVGIDDVRQARKLVRKILSEHSGAKGSRNQEIYTRPGEDIMQDQLSVKEYEEPFRGSGKPKAMWLEQSESLRL